MGELHEIQSRFSIRKGIKLLPCRTTSIQNSLTHRLTTQTESREGQEWIHFSKPLVLALFINKTGWFSPSPLFS